MPLKHIFPLFHSRLLLDAWSHMANMTSAHFVSAKQFSSASINMQSTDMETILVFHRSYNLIQSQIYGCFQGHNFGLRGYVWSNFHGWLESDLGGWLPMFRTCLQVHGVCIYIYIHTYIHTHTYMYISYMYIHIHICIYHICIQKKYIHIYIYKFTIYILYIYIYITKTQLIVIQKKHVYSWLVRPTNTTFGATNMGIWPWTIAEMTCDWLLLSSFYVYIYSTHTWNMSVHLDPFGSYEWKHVLTTRIKAMVSFGTPVEYRRLQKPLGWRRFITSDLRWCYLVGGIPTPLKNMKVSWDYSSQYMEK